ncbi:hypothetical protein KW805_02360 [Candidatus Pacearchaeota archaeon]|nr:hypothetical protein [Candidatus Pacearchaeota archaeon]
MDNTNRIKIAFQVTMGIALTLAIASAAGVSTEYWNGPQEHPLELSAGETKDIVFTLQNMVGADDVSFQAAIIAGNSFAQITDKDLIYAVPIGTKDKEVHVRISLPANATLGETHDIGAAFTTITPQQSGFKLGSAFEEHFNLVTVEKKQLPANTSQTTQQGLSSNTLYFVIGALVLAVVVIAIIARKRANKV